MPQDFESTKPRRREEEKDRINDTKNDNRFREAKSNEADDRVYSDQTDSLARRDEQAEDYKGETQNVNDDAGRPLDEEELDHERNKATEGKREQS